MIDVFKQEDVDEFIGKVKRGIREGLEKESERFVDCTYKWLEDCLYNVYETSRDRIEDELIASIVRGFLENPTESKYRNLREKIFSEHKEEIMKTLADSAIEDTIKMMVRERTIRFSSFDWDWKTFLVKFIFENWNVFKDDEIIKEQFGKRIEELEHVIDCLEHKLSKATRILEE